MKLILRNDNQYLLRFMRGEEVMGELKSWCIKNGVTAGHFTAIGAVSEVGLAFYNLETKEYESKEYKQPLEITGLIGNIALYEEDAVIHCHGTFSDQDMQVIGGHLNSLVVSGTCEVFLTKLKGTIRRSFDEETGLKLME